MPKYDQTLQNMIETQKLDNKFFYEVAHELIDSLYSLHATGRAYNDLKPENVMFDGCKVRLIDFGMSDKFVDTNGKHLSQ